MEYTIERLIKPICEYEFCQCVYLYQMAMEDVSDNIYYDIWDELKNGIDADLIPVLTELNEKGYRTVACCSGHLEEIEKNGTWRIFISFDEDYDLPGIPLSEKNENFLSYSLEYKGNKKATVQEKNKARLKVLDELLEWAKKLPSIEKDREFRIEDGYVMAGKSEQVG